MWSNPGNGVTPPPQLSALAVEKGAFRSPSTKVTNFTYFTVCRPLHTDEQVLGDQLELIHNSFVPTQDLTWKNCR